MLKFKTKRNLLFLKIVFFITGFYSLEAQITISSLASLKSAVKLSNQTIVLAPGDYNIESLPINSRFFECTGSNNIIDLTGVYIDFPVGSSEAQHFLITGDNNTINGGVFENTYDSGIEEITDYVAYNQNKNNFAYGADPHIVIKGDGNTIVGIKMTIRGSFPYGYGSMYGINGNNVFGLDKRGGIAVQGTNATIDSCELQMRAFGHGIYIQSPSDHTIVKNTTVEGDVRSGADLLAETSSSSLPYRSNYLDYSDHDNPIAIDPTNVFSLCEDGIRVYTNGGSVEIENCTVKKMRGGIRTYLSSGATVKNSTAIDCGNTNWNLPSKGVVTKSSGNFAFAPLTDYRLGRSNTIAEWTIIPSPHAMGSHNLADILGNNHNIVFHRTEGPLDMDETRAIVVSGSNSTILNETEYTIILGAGSSGNKITTCGSVIDNGSANNIIDCNAIPNECGNYDAFSIIEANLYCSHLGVQIANSNAVGYINSGDWVKYEGVDFGLGANSIEVSAATKTSGGRIEIRKESVTGEIIGEIEVSNTGSFTSFETLIADFPIVSGKQDIYLVFNGGSGYLFDVNWFKFISVGLGINHGFYDSNEPSLFPNPVHAKLTIKKSALSVLSIYDISGNKILSKNITSDSHVVDLSKLSIGVYFVEIINKTSRKVIKLIKD